MKRLLFTIVVTTCLLSACAIPLIEDSIVQNADIESVITAIEQTTKPSVTLTVESEQPQVTQTPQLTVMPTVMPTAKPEEQVTEEPTPTLTPTITPTAEPTEAPISIITPTLQPTAQPTPEPTTDNQNDIIPVSSAFINAAMVEINRQREAEGVAPAIFSSSISASCKSHAIAMAQSGSVFHASGIYMFEAVGRASSYMPGATMGSAAVAHVAQLKSDAVTQIGIGAVYYGDYFFYVIRGD